MTISDLNELLRNMQPELQEGSYHMSSVDEGELMTLANYLSYIVGIFRENEGLSIVFSDEILEEMRSISISDPIGPFAMISLAVHSDLMAVGFLAKITDALAKEGISVNAYSAYRHDYLFVPYEKAENALTVLQKLSMG